MFALNRLEQFGLPLAQADQEAIGRGAPDRVRPYLSHWPNPAPTPLHRLPDAARAWPVASIHVKDEGLRLGLGSFKALGGAYAVMRIVQRVAEVALRCEVKVQDLLSPAVRDVSCSLAVSCATDGNHGRSVAAGAQLLGCRAVIFVHQGVSDARVDAITRFGAEIIRVPGSYDDSVDEASRVSAEQGWHVVSDTSWPGYEEIPALVAQGYTVMADEIIHELRESGEAMPTHMFLQAGVGGFAAAMAGHFQSVLGPERPYVVVVEPDRAACLFTSVREGRLTRIPPSEPTLMAMLECYQPSLIAWRVLSRCADAFMTVSDEEAEAAMKALARPRGTDPGIVAGESGAASMAAFVQAIADPGTREALGLGPESRILLINTETATDPQIYQSIVGGTESGNR